MKVFLSIVWLALAGIFGALGWQQSAATAGEPPRFDSEQPKFEISGEGFHFELDMEGTPLDEPFRRFEEDLDAYLAELAETNATARRRGSLACYAAAVAALAGLALVWITPRPAATSTRGPA